jgi:1,4-dihydroxy-2-naphthoate octaprenyltransferase
MQAARVRSLLIATVSVASGAAVAWWGGQTSPMLMLAWLAAVSAQAGTNLTNVSYNYKGWASGASGRQLDPRGSSAPIRAGLLSAPQVRRGAIVCFGVSVIVGAVLAWAVDLKLLWLGVPGLLAGYFYSAPPVRLAYRGLGVVTVFALMGPAMVAGSYWVAAGRLSAGAWAASVAVGLTAAAVMHVNDVRDFADDVAHHKLTLSTALGRSGASWLMAAMLAGAFAAIIVAVAMRALPPLTLLVLLTSPLALRMARQVLVERDPVRLNEAWYLGVKLHTGFGALLVGALCAAAIRR